MGRRNELQNPRAYTGDMRSTQTDEIQQIVAGAVRGRSCEHGQDVDTGIAAVITVERDRRFLASTVRAVCEQSVLPATIVIVDCSGGITTALQSSFEVEPSAASGLTLPAPGAHTVTVRLVGVDHALSFSDAVMKGVRAARIDPGVRGLWMLHDDSRPADDQCLEQLLESWHNAPTACVLGCKQLDWQATALHDVGSYAGRHRVVSLVVDGEPDQEQYDGRRDVYAVSLAGAVVSTATLHTLQSPNPWFGTYRESADFCRRVNLSGGRVVVVPQARVAHRRARFEGIRSRRGEPLDEETPINTALHRMMAEQRYQYTDMHRTSWPWHWVFSLLTSIITAVRLLFSKQPYEAWCTLRLPWLALGSLAPALKARSLVHRQSVLSLSRLPMLVASRRQIILWHERSRALERQRGVVLLSALEKSHLRRRAIRRWVCASLMALLSVLALVLNYRDVLRGVWAGGSLYSDQLLSTSAGFGQLVESATTPWVFGLSTGIPAPPTPWLLVWSVASLFTLGHASAAIAVIYVLSAPVSALSFWALAGVFTRSNAVRMVCSLLWTGLAFGLGLYGTANVAMLTVMMFLPAAFAFVFHAVGMYHTEDLVTPHPSVQAAGCSALCFIAVVASEPQLLLPLLVIFLVFLVLIPRHRAMLLLIPVPAACAVAPTLVNAVRYGSRGLWRQLFGDIAVPQSARNGSPASLSFADIVLRAFGLHHEGGEGALQAPGWLTTATLISLGVLFLLAVASLVLPFALRTSRMMWTVIVAGAVLAMVSARVVIAVDASGPVAGSVEPGISLVMLGMLCCACQVAGGAVSRYRPLSLSLEERERPNADSERTRAILVRTARTVLTLVLAMCVGLWVALGVSRSGVSSVDSGTGGLPMVAVDYLNKNPSHRVLALKADTRTTVSYTVLRTARGDLIDASVAQRAQLASGMGNAPSEQLASAAAHLLTNSDTDSIDAIANLGFGGIYVVGSGDQDYADDAQRDAATELTSNINASVGIQSVVSNASGTYYRVSAVSDNTSRGVDTRHQRMVQTSVWRYIWLWSLGVVVLLYCLVAMPRPRRGGKEEA